MSIKARAVDYFDFVRQFAEVAPAGTTLRWALLGRPFPVRFRRGVGIPAGKVPAPIAKELALLAASGAIYDPPNGTTSTRWKLDLDGGTLTTPGGLRFALDSVQSVIFSETFLYDIHFESFDLTGRTILDAGANVGDTALYFASLGARVEAYEPDPVTYEMLLRNLALNPALRERIRTHPEAVGTDGTVRFRAGLRGGSGIYASGGRPVEVRSVSLATALREADLERAFLLKCDCKGCEFDLVTQPELARFDRIKVEYHTGLGTGSIDQLLADVRAAGFERLRVYKHNFGTYSVERHGVVHGIHRTALA